MAQDNNNVATTVAETNNAPTAPEPIQSGGWTSLVPMVLIFVVFYFLLIRPQEKKRKSQEQLVSSVKPGENVVTHSGLFGKITKVNEE
ncbi:MAG UNVERIFIED_CONTAM: preprotein translocase subunit YajC [Rickettsiaceae bacterium]|jgi:preprotein translocase subunit YajC